MTQLLQEVHIQQADILPFDQTTRVSLSADPDTHRWPALCLLQHCMLVDKTQSRQITCGRDSAMYVWYMYTLSLSVVGSRLSELFSGCLTAGNGTTGWQVSMLASGPFFLGLVHFCPVCAEHMNLDSYCSVTR